MLCTTSVPGRTELKTTDEPNRKHAINTQSYLWLSCTELDGYPVLAGQCVLHWPLKSTLSQTPQLRAITATVWASSRSAGTPDNVFRFTAFQLSCCFLFCLFFFHFHFRTLYSLTSNSSTVRYFSDVFIFPTFRCRTWQRF